MVAACWLSPHTASLLWLLPQLFNVKCIAFPEWHVVLQEMKQRATQALTSIHSIECLKLVGGCRLTPCSIGATTIIQVLVQALLATAIQHSPLSGAPLICTMPSPFPTLRYWANTVAPDFVLSLDEESLDWQILLQIKLHTFAGVML